MGGETRYGHLPALSGEERKGHEKAQLSTPRQPGGVETHRSCILPSTSLASLPGCSRGCASEPGS